MHSAGLQLPMDEKVNGFLTFSLSNKTDLGKGKIENVTRHQKRAPSIHIDRAYLVRVKGLEPLRRKTLDPKSSASAIPPHSHGLLSKYSTRKINFQGLIFIFFVNEIK